SCTRSLVEARQRRASLHGISGLSASPNPCPGEPMKLRRQAGVTLIEILIAVSLLSLLSVGALVAMRIALTTMDKTDAHLVRNRRVSTSEKIIENELAGFMVTRAEWRPTPLRIEVLPFMQFEPQTMRFVTSYSLQDAWRGRAQIAAFQVIPGERN